MKVIDLGQKNETEASLEALKRDLPVIIEQVEWLAQIRMACFKASIEQGFTEEQAFELCKKPFL